MSRTRRSSARQRSPHPSTITVTLSRSEMEILPALARYYLKRMTPMRRVFRLFAPAEIRVRYRFVVEETRWLRQLADHALDEMGDRDEWQLALTPRALVAFLGRVIANLESPRARRRLRPEGLAVREATRDKLADALAALSSRNPSLAEAEIASRRPKEAEWMRRRLEGSKPRPQT